MINERSGQIKMFENVGVLVVFFFLLMTGIIFYFSYQEKAINEQFFELNKAKSFRVAEIVFSMPELGCYYNNAHFYACIDEQKMIAFQKYAGDHPEVYFPILGFAEIKLDNQIIYEYLPEKQKDVFAYNLPVVLFSPDKNKRCGDTALRGLCEPKNLMVKYYAS
ncbi:hypothetical protein COV11_03235 [Candidatus Woesearchaeota archaeon CG10_big_fil_rev_8_21_14_0_10_30_7]|nr:MAG: hypothetical protein COV11_03235 [Candidatus Woesearchaeota archaeon CG10_big_fil_rev_8_21_14_0_10_30_7]